MADGTVIIPVRWWDGEEPERSLDGAKARLGRLRPGEQFAYTFDLGDNWQHLCTVAPQRADPLETLGIIPVGPLPCWGWATSPTSTAAAGTATTAAAPCPRAPAGWLTSRQSCPGGDPAGHGERRHLLTAARSATATWSPRQQARASLGMTRVPRHGPPCLRPERQNLMRRPPDLRQRR